VVTQWTPHPTLDLPPRFARRDSLEAFVFTWLCCLSDLSKQNARSCCCRSPSLLAVFARFLLLFLENK